MPHPHTPRATLARVLVGTTIAGLAVGGTVFSATTAGAATSTVVAITAVGPHLVPALTTSQVITVTGSGFDEAVISSVAVAGCTSVSYVVASPTTMYVKTDATCAAGLNAVVTITDTSSNTAASVPAATGGAQKLDFVTAPSIAASTTTAYAATTEATAASGVAYANKKLTVSTKGGSVVRVTSGSSAFATSTAFPLAASLDGVPMTNIVIGGGTSAGNYFTATVGAHPAANLAPVLKITNNGVSKSFPYAAAGASTNTHSLQYAGSTIAVTPVSGAVSGGTVLTIAGAGFSTTSASDVITVGGVSCPVTGTPTATSVKCTVPASASSAPGPVTVRVAVTGGLTSVISPTSTFTYLDE